MPALRRLALARTLLDLRPEGNPMSTFGYPAGDKSVSELAPPPSAATEGNPMTSTPPAPKAEEDTYAETAHDLGHFARAFTEWDRRYREEPERFELEAARLLRGTPESYGEECAPYFAQILEETR